MADLDRTYFLLIPRPRLGSEVREGLGPVARVESGSSGEASVAQRTVQRVDELDVTGLRAEGSGEVSLLALHNNRVLMREGLCGGGEGGRGHALIQG